MLGTELLVTVLSLRATGSEELRIGDLLRFGAFLACALAHVVATRESEERRRGVKRQVAHIDQTSVWLFSSALVLPVPWVLVLVLVVRVQRYMIARRPMATFTFTTASITASVLGVDLLARSCGLRQLLTGKGPWPDRPQEMLAAAAGMTAAVAVYFLVQALLVGVARGLWQRSWSVELMLGDRQTNWFVLTTLFLGVCAALTHALSPILTLIMVPLTVRSSRDRQMLEQSNAENDRLRADVWHDALTELLNRRAFDANAGLVLLGDQQEDRPTALLFLDIDHFKRVNDTLGHSGGDELLKAVAGVLRAHTRSQDHAVRWGGEEFALLLPNTDLDEARVIAERVRIAVSALDTQITKPAGGKPVRLGEDGVPRCTISIGLAVAPEHGSEVTELHERADQALYRAKQAGRNQVVVAPRRHASRVDCRTASPS